MQREAHAAKEHEDYRYRLDIGIVPVGKALIVGRKAAETYRREHVDDAFVGVHSS